MAHDKLRNLTHIGTRIEKITRALSAPDSPDKQYLCQFTISHKDHSFHIGDVRTVMETPLIGALTRADIGFTKVKNDYIIPESEQTSEKLAALCAQLNSLVRITTKNRPWGKE